MTTSNLILVLAITAAVLALIVLALLMRHFNLWLQATLAGVPISFVALVRMRLRKLPVERIVLARIQAKKAGLDLTTRQLQIHHLAGGNVRRVVAAMVQAKEDGQPLTWDEACAADLAKAEGWDEPDSGPTKSL